MNYDHEKLAASFSDTRGFSGALRVGFAVAGLVLPDDRPRGKCRVCMRGHDAQVRRDERQMLSTRHTRFQRSDA